MYVTRNVSIQEGEMQCSDVPSSSMETQKNACAEGGGFKDPTKIIGLDLSFGFRRKQPTCKREACRGSCL